jgi:hypothetical protein
VSGCACAEARVSRSSTALAMASSDGPVTPRSATSLRAWFQCVVRRTAPRRPIQAFS